MPSLPSNLFASLILCRFNSCNSANFLSGNFLVLPRLAAIKSLVSSTCSLSKAALFLLAAVCAPLSPNFARTLVAIWSPTSGSLVPSRSTSSPIPVANLFKSSSILLATFLIPAVESATDFFISPAFCTALLFFIASAPALTF